MTAAVARLTDAAVSFPTPDGRGVRDVFHDVSIDLRDGELLVLVGRSGCGKTTALNLMAGLLEPTRGTVSVFGSAPRVGRPDVGYMFAKDALLPWRTVLRNVEIGLECRGVDRKERRRKAREFLRLVHLDGYADDFPGALSHGMRQRVALARTWSMSPRLLLMDEPFAALDAQTRTSVRDEFVRLWELDRRSVVFVTHDLNEAIVLGDRILVFAEGRVAGEFVVDFDRPRDIVALGADPRMQAMYADIRALLAEQPTQQTRRTP